MLTIFAIPKPFEGVTAIHQRNALQSWLALRPLCEVILVGDDSGVADVAREFGVKHIPEVARNEQGTPLLDSAFRKAQEMASFQTMAYVNADIILLDDLLEAAGRIPFSRFLASGRRWNIDLDQAVDFSQVDWGQRLREDVLLRGKLFTADGMDYFIFRRDKWSEMPSFAVGRPGWDNWMVFRARELKMPTLDATESVMAVHPNHHYRHVRNARRNWEGPEGDRNLELVGGGDRVFTLCDATHVLTADRIRRNRCGGDSERCMHVYCCLNKSSFAARSRLCRLVIETWYELIIRAEGAFQGHPMALLKFPGWAIRRLFLRSAAE